MNFQGDEISMKSFDVKVRDSEGYSVHAKYYECKKEKISNNETRTFMNLVLKEIEVFLSSTKDQVSQVGKWKMESTIWRKRWYNWNRRNVVQMSLRLSWKIWKTPSYHQARRERIWHARNILKLFYKDFWLKLLDWTSCNESSLKLLSNNSEKLNKKFNTRKVFII